MKIRFAVILCLTTLANLALSDFADADVTNISVAADTEATLENFTPLIDDSTEQTDMFDLEIVGNGNGSTANSISETMMDYMWDGTSLTGSALITHTKTQNAKAGGLHEGSGNLCFSFTIDVDTDYVLDGAFGYVGATAAGEADSVMWSLVSTDSGTFSQSGAAPQNTTAVDGAPISESGTLSPGDYKFTMSADFHETINNQEVRQAGWTLNGFTLTASSVPEPSSACLILASMMLIASRRRVAKR